MQLSIIIPAYKCQKTIIPVLDAIFTWYNEEYEVNVVMDGPDPDLEELIRTYAVNLYILDSQKGPAFARNFGARKSKGEYLLFLDSDVVLQTNPLKEIKKFYHEIENLSSVVLGIYDIEPANPRPTTWFQSIKKRIDYNPEHNQQFSTISGSIFALPKSIFDEIGGFSEFYNSNTVEDFELGHRLRENHSIVLTPSLYGKHFFPSYGKMLKNYYQRSKQWIHLFKHSKKFETGAASRKNSLHMLMSLLLIVAMGGMILSIFPNLGQILLYASLLLLAFSMLWLLLSDLRFLSLIRHEVGIGFAVISYFMRIILDYFTFAGVIGGLFFSRKNRSPN